MTKLKGRKKKKRIRKSERSRLIGGDTNHTGTWALPGHCQHHSKKKSVKRPQAAEKPPKPVVQGSHGDI